LQGYDHINYVAGFHAQWDAEFFSILYSIVKNSDDKYRNMGLLHHTICKQYVNTSYSRIIYTENHDTIPPDRQCRMPIAIVPNCAEDAGAYFFALKRSVLAAIILLTVPGIPMILQGQEIFELTCCEWPNPITTRWDKMEENKHVFRIYQELCHLRKNQSKKTKGLVGSNVRVYHTNDIAKVIAYYRFDRGGTNDDTIIVANFSDKEFPSYRIGFPRPGKWKVRFNSDSKEYHHSFGDVGGSVDVEATPGDYDQFLFNGSVAVGRYAAVILSQDYQH